MCAHRIHTVDAGVFRYNTRYISQPSSDYFDPAQRLLQAQAVHEGGRNAAWFIQLNSTAAVLRYYRRGGLLARLIKRHYVWTGAQRTRSWAEYAVLAHLYKQGVAVPEPIAAVWQRCAGFSYTAAIIVKRIPQAVPIAQHLATTSPQSVAVAIKHMHEAGVWHADLNVFNILVTPEQQIYLIDFDKAQHLNVVDSKQRQTNLLRLRRSLIKVRGTIGLQWYQQLYSAYQSL